MFSWQNDVFPGGREGSGKWGYLLLQPVYREEPMGTSGVESAASSTTPSTFSISAASRLARGHGFHFRYSLESVLQVFVSILAPHRMFDSGAKKLNLFFCSRLLYTSFGSFYLWIPLSLPFWSIQHIVELQSGIFNAIILEFVVRCGLWGPLSIAYVSCAVDFMLFHFCLGRDSLCIRCQVKGDL